MNKVKQSFSWIEVVVALAAAIIIARFIWAKELVQLESSIFQSLGIDESTKYFFTVPLFCLVLYGYYKRGALQVKGTGRKVISSPVIIFAVISLIVTAIYLWSLGK
jgi:hypothetical protein